tara:strand:- start:2022 stop:2615 length:594 start_codon:yes stop_codon:yes gene_type:complete
MPDFIYSNFVKDKTLPERIKDYFYKNPDYHRKGVGYQIEKGPEDNHLNDDKNIKDSTDICFSLDKSVNIDIVSDLLKELQIVLEEYMQKYPWCNNGDPFTINTFNIQNYKPNKGFYEWHCERLTSFGPIKNRHLVWMMYCDDLEDEGGTEFLHQNYISKSEKGKILIWPADWTFTHKGQSCTKEKTIITGWYDFYQK